MISSTEIQNRLERILLTVQKPGRYVGGELNQVVKNWAEVDIRVALVFPDIYDIGLPNLGLAILYDGINQRKDALAERAYAPWLDMEAAMRAAQIPLYSLESKQPLAAFDMIGFSLPYETLYTNVLNLLDLAQIPLRSSERNETHPIILAGGHAAFNPEPMADFIDIFAIGEGEDIIQEVIDAFGKSRKAGLSRSETLAALSKIEGIYVPSLYHVYYQPDGKIERIDPTSPSAPKYILKRIVGQLPPPTIRFLVPSIEVVHNRIAVEIMRGCARGCRFCHAGMINRPVRERPIQQIVSAIQEGLVKTGYEEVALLSLSSSDYTHIVELVQNLAQNFAGKHISITLPSLRIESFSAELMDELKESRPGGGFTLAPEAATERMRQIINKPVDTEQLLETARAVFSHGWTTLKLYFMIGLPSETLEDVRAIAKLCNAVLAEGRRIVGGRAKVHVGVSTFVPKPHTPFQWVACDTLDQIREKQDLLKREFRDRNLKMSWTQPEETYLETWLARGDRRLGEVIYRAWKAGSKFDAWEDKLLYPIWIQSFQDSNLDPSFYLHRQKDPDEILPWDMIHTGIRKSFLFEEYQKSMSGELTGFCRDNCYACGILPTFNSLRANYPGSAWKCPEVKPNKILKPAEIILVGEANPYE